MHFLLTFELKFVHSKCQQISNKMKILNRLTSIFHKEGEDDTYMSIKNQCLIEPPRNIFSEKTKYEIFREEFHKEFANTTGIPQRTWSNICADAWAIGPELGLIIHSQQHFYDTYFAHNNWNWKELKRWQEFFVKSGQLPEIEFLSLETTTPEKYLEHFNTINLKLILKALINKEYPIGKMNKNELIGAIKKHSNFSHSKKFNQVKASFNRQYEKELYFKMMILLMRAIFHRTFHKQEMLKHQDMEICYTGIAPFEKEPFYR